MGKCRNTSPSKPKDKNLSRLLYCSISCYGCDVEKITHLKKFVKVRCNSALINRKDIAMMWTICGISIRKKMHILSIDFVNLP